MDVIIAFIAGLFVGSIFGALTMALCVAAGEIDETFGGKEDD